MRPSGSNVRQLTFNDAQEFGPNWSPDSRMLGFASDQDDNFSIFTMRADGTRQRNLTDTTQETAGRPGRQTAGRSSSPASGMPPTRIPRTRRSTRWTPTAATRSTGPRTPHSTSSRIGSHSTTTATTGDGDYRRPLPDSRAPRLNRHLNGPHEHDRSGFVALSLPRCKRACWRSGPRCLQALRMCPASSPAPVGGSGVQAGALRSGPRRLQKDDEQASRVGPPSLPLVAQSGTHRRGRLGASFLKRASARRHLRRSLVVPSESPRRPVARACKPCLCERLRDRTSRPRYASLPHDAAVITAEPTGDPGAVTLLAAETRLSAAAIAPAIAATVIRFRKA